MSRIQKLSLFLLVCAFSQSICAVTVDSRAIKNKSIFGISFPDSSRSYVAKEASISSISLQEYITTSFNVMELNLVSEGSALIRIYHGRPVKPGEIQEALGNGVTIGGGSSGIIQRPLSPQIQALADRASGVHEAITSSTVIKDYPHATHAHTIEYRLASRSELIDLYNQLRMHWIKEPAYFEAGQIVDESESVDKEMKPRSLGGTIFTIEQ